MMISIIIPTLNAAEQLPASLASLVDGAVSGLVKELIIVDGGSDDPTLSIADAAGATILAGKTGRGQQLQQGANAARADWLLFIHADTVLESGWLDEVKTLSDKSKAGIFRFALDDKSIPARILQFMVHLRCMFLALPYGDQGLLISRQLYDEIGGFKPVTIMEDVDIIRRLGRKRLHFFRTRAITSASRYRKDGYLKRIWRNAGCLFMWFTGKDPEQIAKAYK